MIEWLRMVNWRAYDQFDLDLHPGINLVMGPNGAGKTSILEAICFALCGEVSTVRHKSFLVRTPGTESVVQMHMSQAGQTYVIERSIKEGRAHQASLSDARGKVLARTHAGVTAAVEKLVNTRADFFKRLVYMAEGDVFRFLSEAPGNAVNTQIASIIGLSQLDQFQNAITQSTRTLKARLDTLNRLRATIAELRLKPSLQEATDAASLQTLCDELSQRLQDLTVEYQTLNARQHHIAALQGRWQTALFTFQQVGVLDAEAEARPLGDLINELGPWREITESELHALHVTIGENKGSLSTLRQTISLLGSSQEAHCPVCSHSLEHSERDQILTRLQGQVALISANQEAKIAEAERQQQVLTQTGSAWQIIQNLPRELLETDVAAQPEDLTLASLQAHYEAMQDRLAQLEATGRETRAELNDVQGNASAFLATQQHMEAEGFSDEADIRKATVAVERRMLSLAAAEQAIAATRAQQRDTALDEMYTEIGQLWQSFLGRNESWQVRLDDAGNPQLTQVDQARVFDLTQFSGGQKTAFMVMLHTVLSNYFSRARFLLIDEPLEHLDPVNRRSLIRFLLNAYRQGMFEQLIVTTFEESLVRKYANEEGVHLIYVEPPL